MNEIIKCITERRSIRKYKQEQITNEELNQILLAGSYAPNAGGGQSCSVVVMQNKDIISKLGSINRQLFIKILTPKSGLVSTEQPSIADDVRITNAFYDAPTVIVVFAPKTHKHKIEDGNISLATMTFAAHSLGIGSCIIARANETFSTDEGKEILNGWNISSDYEAIGFLTLGYPEGNLPKAKPRKEYVIKRV